MSRIEQERRGEVVILKPCGSLTGGDLNEALEDDVEAVLAEGTSKVVLDFAGVEQINSIGLATVIRLHARTRRESSSLIICAARERVRAAFEVTRVTALGLLCDTLEDALGD